MRDIRKIKKYLVTFFTIVILLNFNIIGVKASPWPDMNTVSQDDNNYYWTGSFYWFGSSTRTEYGGSWNSIPQKPNTLYSPNWGDIQLDGAYENNGQTEFGFYSYDAWWTQGNSAGPTYNYSKGRYEKQAQANYYRTKTNPYTRGALNISSDSNHFYNAGSGNYWVKSNTSVSIDMSYAQQAPGSRHLILNDYIRGTYLGLFGSTREQFFYNSNDGSAWQNENSGGVSIWKRGDWWGGDPDGLGYNASRNVPYGISILRDGLDYTIQGNSVSHNGKYQTDWTSVATIHSDDKAPTSSWTEIKNITQDGYDVYIYGVTDNGRSGVNTVKFPTWTDKNWQDDIIWGEGINLGSGTWYYRVNRSEHNYETGIYHTHIYLYDNVKNEVCAYTNDNINVPYWTTPSTWANGVFKDNNGAPGESVYTDSYGYKWVKPNENFFVGANGKSNSKDQQVNELHTLIYNEDNQSEQQLVKAGIPRGQVWSDAFWQDIKPVNTIQFVGNYGSARRNDKMEMDAKGLNMESYFKFKLTKDNMDYYQGTKALCIDGGQYYWSNDWGFDMYNYIKTDGTAPTVSFYPEGEDWTNSEINVNTYISDERSGVKAWEYRTSSNNGDSYGNWTSIDSTKNSYEIKLSSQGKWMIQVRSTDNVGNSNIVTSGPYKIDRTAPRGTFTPDSSALSILEQKVTFKPSDEGGSGVDYWEYSVSRDDGETWDYEGRYYGDSQEEILLTDIAKCKIQVTIKDKAENTGIVTSGTYNIIVPDPLNGKLEMKKYDFQEYEDLNGNGEKDTNEPLKPVYWVKPESEFRIYTEGYFPSSYGIYPTRSYVLYARDGKVDLSKSARQYSEEEDWGTDGDEYSDYFYNLDNGGLDFSHKDDKNYISHTHVAEATEKSHGNHFKLFYISSFFHGPIDEYHSDYKDSGIWLNVDGKPPTGNGLVEIDYKTLNMTITANDIKDSDSGVNSVWAMIFPYDPDSTSENNIDISDFKGISEYKNDKIMERRLIRKSNGEYSLTLNAYDDAFKNEMVKVVICAKDNVGNKSIIKEENIDLFTLKAKIVPLNNMNYSSSNPPTLEEGQAAVLIMEVTGEAEELKIVYKGINEYDKTLDKTIKIAPVQKYKRVDDNFIVPLYCGEDRYTVEVVAYRQGKKRNASPEFIVSDSVLNGIKTRVR